MIAEIRSKIRSLDKSNRELRKFSALLGVVLGIIAVVLFVKGSETWQIFAGIGGIILFFGLLIPPSIRWFYVVWMTLGLSIGWILTRVILTLTFYLFITPFGLFLRLVLRKDLLDEKSEKEKETFWKKYEPVTDRSRYLKRY
jgi:hypothetical protein